MWKKFRILIPLLFLLGPIHGWEGNGNRPHSGGYQNSYQSSGNTYADKFTYNDKSCGAVYQKCCEGRECDKGAVCKDGKCVECGNDEQLCCEGHKCSRGLACSDLGQCTPCGKADGLICCPRGLCDKNLLCTFEDVCKECGDTDQHCCDDQKCKHGNVCHDNKCVACGTHSGARCCEGEGKECAFISGGPPLKCIADICVACGGKNEPCCPHGGKQCLSGLDPQLTCIAGSCVACGGPNEPCCEGPGKQCESPKDYSYAYRRLEYYDSDVQDTELICVAGTCTPCGGHGEPCCEGKGAEKCLPSYDPCAYDGYQSLCDFRESGLDGYVDPSLACVAGKCIACGGYGEPCCAREGRKCLPSYDPCDYDDKDCYKRKLDQEKAGGNQYVGYLPADDEKRLPLTCVAGSCLPCGGYGEPCCEGGGISCPETYTIEKYANGYRSLEDKDEDDEEFAKFEIHEVPLTCVAGTCEVCGVNGYPCCDVEAFGSFSNVDVNKASLQYNEGAGLVIGTSSCLFPSVCESGTCTY